MDREDNRSAHQSNLGCLVRRGKDGDYGRYQTCHKNGARACRCTDACCDQDGWPDEKNQGCDMPVEEKIRKTFENAGFDDSLWLLRHKFRKHVEEMQMKRMIEDDLNAQ